MRAAMMLALLLGSACAGPGQLERVSTPEECRSICEGWGLELVGMVAGYHFPSCICAVPGAAPGKQASLVVLGGGAAAASEAAALQQRQAAQTKR